MEHVAAHRVTLQVLDDDEVRLALDLEVDEHVERGVGGEGGPQLPPVDGDGLGVAAEAVHDGRDLALGPQPAART